MNKIIVSITVCAALLAGCGRQRPAADPHAGHDHAAHEHTGHEGHDHAAHDHSGHNHEGHDHAGHEGHNHEGHSHAAEVAEPAAEEAHAPDEIIFPAAQAALTDFAVETITPGPFSEVIKTSGQILSAQGDQACLSAPVSGIVSLGGTPLTDGSPVRQGTPLFYISSKNIASGDANAKISATYMKARAEYERMEKLLADRIVSQKEYDAARYEYLQAKAEYDAIAAAQSPRGTAVAAPMTGFVTELSVHDGDFVEMGQVLATVARNRRLELRAEVSQKYYAHLKDIRSASFRTPYGDRMLSLSDMNGRLLSTGQAAASTGYMIPVIFSFDNPGGLVPGSYVEVFLLGAPQGEAMSVPVGAITEQQGFYYVYVQLDEEGYQRRQVTLGPNDGMRVRILSGLKPGERVVTRGAVQVKMAAASGAIPHGHSH